MTAYFGAIRDSISNPQEMKTYGKTWRSSLARQGRFGAMCEFRCHLAADSYKKPAIRAS